jgi:hypothetical protein
MSFNFGATGINSDTAGGGGGDKAPAAQPPSFGDTGSFGSKDDSKPSFPETVCARRGRGAPHLRQVEIKVPPPQKQKMPPRKGVPPNSLDDALSLEQRSVPAELWASLPLNQVVLKSARRCRMGAFPIGSCIIGKKCPWLLRKISLNPLEERLCHSQAQLKPRNSVGLKGRRLLSHLFHQSGISLEQRPVPKRAFPIGSCVIGRRLPRLLRKISQKRRRLHSHLFPKNRRRRDFVGKWPLRILQNMGSLEQRPAPVKL